MNEGRRNTGSLRGNMAKSAASGDLQADAIAQTAAAREHRQRLSDRAARSAIALTTAGYPGRAARNLLRDAEDPTVEKSFDDVLSDLKLLHPDGPQLRPLPPAPLQQVCSDEVVEVLSRLAAGKTAGNSGWTEELLRDACQVNAGAAASVAALVSDAINNVLPPAARDALAAARLVGIPKTSGGTRPIAIAECIAKVAGSCSIRRCSATVETLLGDDQFGLKEGGNETIAHDLAGMLDDRTAAIAVDFRNAFNSVFRTDLREALTKDVGLKPLWGYFDFAYGTPSALRVFRRGEPAVDLESKRGVRQGDPTASALFCLALAPVLAATKVGNPGVRVMAFMDDVYLVGAPDLLPRAFETLASAAGAIGLESNRSKCKVYGTGAAGVAAQTDIVDSGLSLIALSVCISKLASEKQKHLDSKLQHYSKFFDAIIRDDVPTEVSWQLLAACGPARWTYWARTHPPDEVAAQHVKFDDMLAACFRKIALIDEPLTEEHRALMHMPVALGGLGLQRFEWIAPLAFAASSSTDPDKPSQEELTANYNKELHGRLSREVKRHLDITNQDGASQWLVPKAHTCVRRPGFALALQHRIRAHSGAQFTIRCDGCGTSLKHADFDGHVLGCARRKGYGPNYRHHRLRSAVKTLLLNAGIEVREEVHVTDSERMDLVVYLPGGTEIWLDVTVYGTDGKSQKHRDPMHLEEAAYQQKRRRYEEVAADQKTIFHPLPFSVYGGVGSETRRVLKKLAAIAELPMQEVLRATSFAIACANGRILAAARTYKTRAWRRTRSLAHAPLQGASSGLDAWPTELPARGLPGPPLPTASSLPTDPSAPPMPLLPSDQVGEHRDPSPFSSPTSSSCLTIVLTQAATSRSASQEAAPTQESEEDDLGHATNTTFDEDDALVDCEEDDERALEALSAPTLRVYPGSDDVAPAPGFNYCPSFDDDAREVR